MELQIFAPNGINASFAILKYCFPNGIPTIVKQQTRPMMVASTARVQPVKHIHTMFSRKLPALPIYSTVLPKGKKHSLAILKHCLPTGIPIIVIDQIRPAKHQRRPVTAPPSINHIMLPSMLTEPPPLCHIVVELIG